MFAGTKFLQNNVLFVGVSALAYVVVVLLLPPHTPLLEPDSTSYLSFSPFRPLFYPAFLYVCRSIGLGLIEITWVQVAVFAGALSYLLVVLLRIGFPKWLLAAMVALLAANVLFSSFHRSILSESLCFSVDVVAIAWWIEYLRTGNIRFLVGAGLMLGLMIGIRSAAVGLVPLHLIAVWMRRPRGLGLLVSLLLAGLSVGIVVVGERMLAYLIRGSDGVSQVSLSLFGKAALLIKPGMTFSGPHAPALDVLGKRLIAVYGPVQRDIENAPSLPVRAQLSALYEDEAQYRVLTHELLQAAMREQTSVGTLQAALGRQVILQNPLGYLKLTLLNALGQWSVAARNFPPAARSLAAYADAHPGMTLGGRIPATVLHPPPSRIGLVVYPGFLLAGAVTLVLAFGVFVFIARPALIDGRGGFYLLVAVFFSAMCQGYTFFVSAVNMWTPRYLMVVFPQLALIAICMVMAMLVRFARPAGWESSGSRPVLAGRFGHGAGAAGQVAAAEQPCTGTDQTR